jgi:hypothetical protein
MHPKIKPYFAVYSCYKIILETLIETGGAPSSIIYLALNSLGITIDQHYLILDTLKKKKAIKVSAHYISPASKINEVLDDIKKVLVIIETKNKELIGVNQ